MINLRDITLPNTRLLPLYGVFFYFNLVTPYTLSGI